LTNLSTGAAFSPDTFAVLEPGHAAGAHRPTRPIEAPLPSFESVCDVSDSACNETVMELFKNEATVKGAPLRKGALRSLDDIE